MSQTINLEALPTGTRKTTPLPRPGHIPLDAIPEPNGARNAMAMLRVLRRLPASTPFAEFDPADGQSPHVRAIADLFLAGLVSVVEWEDTETGERGAAVSPYELVQVPTGGTVQ